MRLRLATAALGAALLVGGCATLQQIAALRQVAFALDGIRDGRLAGVPLDRYRSVGSLSPSEVGRVAVALARGTVPLEFTLGVRAENPPDNRATASLVRLAWTFLLDGEPTVSGVVDSVVALPPGEARVIPMRIGLDLAEFVDGPAEDLVRVALSVAGLDREPTRVALRAVPTVDTPLGPIRYPQPITIVEREVGGAP